VTGITKLTENGAKRKKEFPKIRCRVEEDTEEATAAALAPLAVMVDKEATADKEVTVDTKTLVCNTPL
jgi:hypothetical protein